MNQHILHLYSKNSSKTQKAAILYKGQNYEQSKAHKMYYTMHI